MVLSNFIPGLACFGDNLTTIAIQDNISRKSRQIRRTKLCSSISGWICFSITMLRLMFL